MIRIGSLSSFSMYMPKVNSGPIFGPPFLAPKPAVNLPTCSSSAQPIDEIQTFSHTRGVPSALRTSLRMGAVLGSKRMGSVIDALGERADIILFDAPPILAATDAVVLATKVAGVLLVVSAGETKRDSLRDGVARLEKVNASIVGAVLNKVPMGSGIQSYYG